MAKRTQTKEAPASFDAFDAAVHKVLDYGRPKKVKERRGRKGRKK